MVDAFIADFVAELVTEHGYDHDILINTWNTVVPKKTEPVATNTKTPPTPKTKVKKTCPYIYESGKKKNQTCGTWVKSVHEMYCTKHTEDKLAKVQKDKLFDHLVKAFENLSTSYGGDYAELVYDPDTGYPIIKYKFPTKVANFIKTIPKEVLQEFAQEQAAAAGVGKKIEESWESTFCDCHKYN